MSTEPRVVRFMDTIHALEPEQGGGVSSFDNHLRNRRKTFSHRKQERWSTNMTERSTLERSA